MKWANLPFKAESELVRWWYRLTKEAPTSEPYLSGDGFRTLADWFYEPATVERFDPREVTAGSLGFCDGWLLRQFFVDVAPKISAPFSLISHNADPNIADEIVTLLPGGLKRLFAMNKVTVDDRVVALPIGLENARYHYNGITRDFDQLRRSSGPRMPRVLCAFSPETNPLVRHLARETLQRMPVVDTLARINSRAYRKVARRYQFVASPPGNGEDCHRTWEALYLGCIPIVRRSCLAEEFAARGIPLWIVDSYSELEGLTEQDLDQRYRTFLPGLQSPFLWFSAWRDLIARLR